MSNPLTPLEAELLAALKDVLAYRTGQGRYNFAYLSDDQSANAAFDAWEGVEVRIRAAIARAERKTS